MDTNETEAPGRTEAAGPDRPHPKAAGAVISKWRPWQRSQKAEW